MSEPREPFDSGIDDLFERIAEERTREIEEGASKLADRSKSLTSAQLEAAIERRFPSHLSTDAHVDELKRIAVHQTAVLLTIEPIARKGLATGNRALREIDVLRMEQSHSIGGAIKAMKSLEKAVGVRIDDGFSRMKRDRAIPGLAAIILGISAIICLGMLANIDAKLIIGLTGTFTAAAYQLAKIKHDRKIEKDARIEASKEPKQ